MTTEVVSARAALPSHWPRYVKSAMVHTISLAHMAITWSRSWATNAPLQRARLAAQLDQARSEVSLLREEIRIKDARWQVLPARNRPHYCAVDRLAILEVRAARSWSVAQTARAFLVDEETVSSWMKRLDEEGPRPLVRVPVPVNRFSDYVRHVVQRLKVLCPTLGKKRIAQLLARAGLRLSASTVGRVLKKTSAPPPPETPSEPESGRVVTAKYPHHVWHVDLTVVPTRRGMWTSWFPFSLPQVWPFGWVVAVVMDHFSRKVLGVRAFRKEPTSAEVCRFLHRTVRRTGVSPRHIVSDKGSQFWCRRFKRWCRSRKIRTRFGAVGKYGSIAIVERFIRSLKDEGIRPIQVPLNRRLFHRELLIYSAWYNNRRPHQALNGRTPKDLHGTSPPEQTSALPTDGPIHLDLRFAGGHRHLPVVTLRQAA